MSLPELVLEADQLRAEVADVCGRSSTAYAVAGALYQSLAKELELDLEAKASAPILTTV